MMQTQAQGEQEAAEPDVTQPDVAEYMKADPCVTEPDIIQPHVAEHVHVQAVSSVVGQVVAQPDVAESEKSISENQEKNIKILCDMATIGLTQANTVKQLSVKVFLKLYGTVLYKIFCCLPSPSPLPTEKN